MSKSEKSLIFILIFLGALTAFYFKGLAIQNKIWDEESAQQALLGKIYSDSFSQVRLEGKSAIVFDPSENKAIFSMHPDLSLPLASITKVMTAIVALDEMPPSTVVTIPKSALDEDGDSGLFLGEKWDLDDLISFMLIVSSNDAAHAVSLAQSGNDDNSSFITEMNKKAADLGLSKTRFSNETGLDIDTVSSGAYSSPADVAKLIYYGFSTYKDIFEATSKPEETFVSENGFKHDVKNTDNLVGPNSEILVSKTGYTDLAGGNLAVVFQTPSGKILVAVIMGSTENGRFSDIGQLMDAASKYENDIISYANGKDS